jgi:oligoendopeptidase F
VGEFGRQRVQLLRVTTRTNLPKAQDVHNTRIFLLKTKAMAMWDADTPVVIGETTFEIREESLEDLLLYDSSQC